MKSRCMHITIVLLLAVALTACSGNEPPGQTTADTAPAPETDSEFFAAQLAAAQSAQKAAASAGAEWLETGKLIDQAKRNAEQERWDTAIKLAMKAKQQGELAVAQAKRESDAWQRRVVQ